MTPELIRKCKTCWKIQEWKQEWYYIVLTWNDCECWGKYEISFNN